jgi:hypothetical protein
MGNDTPDRHITDDELARRFQFHSADSANQQEAHEIVRTTLLEAASKIVQVTGAPSREQSTVITKLEEALFWAKADLDRKDGPRL